MQGEHKPENLQSQDMEHFQMEIDLKHKLIEFDEKKVNIVSKNELTFTFSSNMIKKIIFYSEEPNSYLMLFYFGPEQGLVAYATTEPRRPYYFKRINTMLGLIEQISSGQGQAPIEITLYFSKGLHK